MMKQSTLILVLSGLIGAPIWLIVDARQALGSGVFTALVAISIVGGLIGLAKWALELDDPER